MVDFEKEVRLQATLDALNFMRTQTQQIIDKLRGIAWNDWAQKIRTEIEKEDWSALNEFVCVFRGINDDVGRVWQPAEKIVSKLARHSNFVGDCNYQSATNRTLTRLIEEKQSASNDRDL